LSHTAQISADYSNQDALAAAVKILGGHLGGTGTHCLYSSREQGLAIILPNWHYPIVVRPDGTLAYDDYNGAWGNVADLDRLHEEYSWALTEIAAHNVGWQTERIDEGVRVYHPSGATITVTSTKVDLSGFVGGACLEAMRQLALPLEAVQDKPALGECVSTCQESV
jgi:hypothetical protein